MNIYIVYELGKSNSYITDPTIKYCLFGAVTLTKNDDIDKYKYSGYGIGFDKKGSFSFPGGGYGQNVINFGADMNSSKHIDNKGKDILILGTSPTQGFCEHSLTVEKIYSINFTDPYNFSVNYDAISVDDIKDIHNYLMKKKIYMI